MAKDLPVKVNNEMPIYDELLDVLEERGGK